MQRDNEHKETLKSVQSHLVVLTTCNHIFKTWIFIWILEVITGCHGQNQSDLRINQKDGRSEPETLVCVNKGLLIGGKRKNIHKTVIYLQNLRCRIHFQVNTRKISKIGQLGKFQTNSFFSLLPDTRHWLHLLFSPGKIIMPVLCPFLQNGQCTHYLS